VWAVGSSFRGNPNPTQTLIEHWNGKRWSIVPSPVLGGTARLNGVDAFSSRDVWAVGIFSPTSTTTGVLIEHWDGKQWNVVPSPAEAVPFTGCGSVAALNAVAVVSACDVWAVGLTSSSSGVPQRLIEHWNGKRWGIVSSPSPGNGSNALSGVSVDSARSVWAVGSFFSGTGSGPALIEHWNGVKWSVVANPSLVATALSLNAVTVVKQHLVWTVGNASKLNNGGPAQATLTEQWNGERWRIIASANQSGSQANFLNSVAAVNGDDIWAVGDFIDSTGGHTLIEHWNGARWSIVPSPS
jgi:hypothetical protein